MSDTARNRLVILSGPSCVGKSPLQKCLARFYPDLYRRLRPIVLFNSRAPRPGETDGVDYHFRTRPQIEARRGQQRYVVMEVRNDLQALDLVALAELLQESDAFFEGNPTTARVLQSHPRLTDVPRLSVFLAPVSREEILFLKDPERHVALPDLITDIMRRKLLRRTRRQKLELSAMDLADIEVRAGSAYAELQQASWFDWVIPNHDGEDSDNWDAFQYPLGDARKALHAFAALLDKRESPGLERWDPNLLP